MNEKTLKRKLHEAVKAAIEEMGIEEFKKCSFFPLSNSLAQRTER